MTSRVYIAMHIVRTLQPAPACEKSEYADVALTTPALEKGQKSDMDIYVWIYVNTHTYI